MNLRFRGEEPNNPPNEGKTRLEATPGITNFSMRNIENAGDDLKQRLNEWLRFDGFFRIWQRLLMNVRQDEEIRLIIETENPQLRLLPWHLWEFVESHRKAEVALSALEFDCPFRETPIPKTQARILAILGDSTGIDITTESRELENLPGKPETIFLVEESCEEVYEKLWDTKGWDILFFAGHSVTEDAGTEGKIFVNRNEFVTISKLKQALTKGIERGLKLAIFNSCDGLGIASQLASFNIPNAIVMREPVPDLVAQSFLKYFLAAYSRPESLYLAVREARARLERLEDKFPCASWLPVIFQNPAEEVVSWQNLCSPPGST